jgi:hypothetical protein
MKKVRILVIISLLIVPAASNLYAQNNIPQDTATIIVPKQQLLSQELQKF